MYEQNLLKIVEPIKKTTINRLNKGKKWKYGYNKEHDLVVISKTGEIGEIYEIQNFQIALPKERSVYSNKEKKWKQFEYPKELGRLKNIFDWRAYAEENKAKWFDYIDYYQILLQSNMNIKETKKNIIQAGHKAVEELIKVAKEAIVDSDDDISADRLKNAAATKKLAIFDAFEILNKIQDEQNMLDGKLKEDKPQAFGGFAENRST